MPVANTQPVFPPVSGQPVASTWGQAVSEHVNQRFTSITDRDAKWTTPPNGGEAFTTDNNGVKWVRRNGVWVPIHMSCSGGWQSVGGFPAGEYSWPSAGPGNIAAYMSSSPQKDLMFPGALTAWLGNWTVEIIWQTNPSDAGDVMLTLTFDGLAHATTGKPSGAIVSVMGFDMMTAGKAITWRMFKYANTGNWTSSYVRFNVTYQASY